MHSTTAKRHVQKIDTLISLDNKVKSWEAMRANYTEKDREVKEEYEASEMFREFIKTELRDYI